MPFETRSAKRASSQIRNGIAAGSAGDHHQPEARERAHEVRPGEAIGLDLRGAHFGRDPCIQRLAFRVVTDVFEQFVQFLLHHGHSGAFIRRAAHGLRDAPPFAASEQLGHEVHRRVDDAPGDVAADERDEQITRAFARLRLR